MSPWLFRGRKESPAPWIVIGHRGACGHAPENTLRSFQKALELGVDAVELDVWLSGERLVVIHDQALDRTTNGRGNLQDLSWDELRRLDAGEGQCVPTLDEVLDLIDRRVWINIELKGPGTALPVVRTIQERLAAGWQLGHFLVSSFDLRQLETARQAHPGIRLGVLFRDRDRDYLEVARALGAEALHPRQNLVTRAWVQTARAAGFKVYPYTVNSPRDIARMRALGVDGVFTNFPERCRA